MGGLYCRCPKEEGTFDGLREEDLRFVFLWGWKRSWKRKSKKKKRKKKMMMMWRRKRRRKRGAWNDERRCCRVEVEWKLSCQRAGR